MQIKINKKNLLISVIGIVLVLAVISGVIFVVQSNKIKRAQELERQRLLAEEARKNIFSPDIFGDEANSIIVSFEVTVPEWTPREDKIYLVIEDYQTQIDGRLSRGLPMKQKEGDVWAVAYRAKSGKKFQYKFNRNNSGYDADEEFFPDTADAWRAVEVENKNLNIKNEVKKWRWLSDEKLESSGFGFQPDYIPKRNEPFVMGIFMLDYYDAKFKQFIPITFDRIKEKGFSYVGLVDLPTFIIAAEPLKIIAGPQESFDFIDYAIQEATKRGLKVMLASRMEAQWDNHVQINNKLHEPHSNAWFANYVEAWKNSIVKSAAVAKKNNIFLFIPSNPWPLFQYESMEQREFVNSLVNEAYISIKKAYPGKLSADLYVEDAKFDFYKQLNWIGDRWDFPLADRKETDLEYMAAQAEKIIVEKYQPIFEKYKKPLFLQQVVYGSYDGAAGAGQFPDESLEIADWLPYDEKYPADFLEQADAHEAFFRAVFDEPIFAGFMVPDYTYWNSQDKLFGVRDKPAEDVWAKWSNILK